jgi:hypothetical protein
MFEKYNLEERGMKLDIEEMAGIIGEKVIWIHSLQTVF